MRTVTALGPFLIACTLSLQSARPADSAEAEVCGECQDGLINPNQPPYCGGEILSRHMFWAQSEYGAKRGPVHIEFRCGECNVHQDCANRFNEAIREFALLQKYGSLARTDAKSFAQFIQVASDGTTELRDCEGRLRDVIAPSTEGRPQL